MVVIVLGCQRCGLQIGCLLGIFGNLLRGMRRVLAALDVLTEGSGTAELENGRRVG